jgi:hypothetical protein
MTENRIGTPPERRELTLVEMEWCSRLSNRDYKLAGKYMAYWQTGLARYAPSYGEARRAGVLMDGEFPQ